MAKHLTPGQAFKKADALGISGFDIDMDLQPYQNLDMFMSGFDSDGSNNRWFIPEDWAEDGTYIGKEPELAGALRGGDWCL